MAEVTSQAPWTSSETRAQFRAIAALRWQIFRNGLRRKGGKGDLAARILMVPIFLVLLGGPTLGAGLTAWFAASHDKLPLIALILWVVFGVSQFAGIQLGQAGTTFDPTQLIRFPLNFRGYVAIRIFFGLISPSNTLATLASFAVALGITIADPSLAVIAFAALAAFALANIFFTRMIFSWVDRWLSTRRSREVFTAAIFAFSLGIQYLNFTFNGAFRHGHQSTITAARVTAALHVYTRAQPVLAMLPPGLVARALITTRDGSLAPAILYTLGILIYAACFLAVFAYRLHKEFRGENLSNTANAVAKPKAQKPATHPALSQAPAATAPSATPSRFSTPPTVSGVLAKEFLTMRRNTGVFYAIIAPLVFVVLIVSKLASHSPVWIVFPGAIAYTMLGIAPLAYNSLGLEATGIQFYFLAPVRWRDVFFAKNLMNLALAAFEFVATYATVVIAAHAPSITMTLSALLWAIFVMSINMAVGNHRSVTSPKKLDPAKLSGKQAPQLSGLIAIGILIGLSAVGAGAILATRAVGQPWLLMPAMLALAVLGVIAYRSSLNSVDALVANNRDTLIEVLCNAS